MFRIVTILFAFSIPFRSHAQVEEISQLTVVGASCAGIDTMSLILYKENNVISAHVTWKGSNLALTPNSAVLTEKQYALYRRFVKELKKLKEGGSCTTQDLYKLVERGKVIEKMDGHCEWFGIDKLLKQLFHQ